MTDQTRESESFARPTVVALVQINSALSWTRQRRKRTMDHAQPAAAGEKAHDKYQGTNNYSIFPYSVGLLQSYAQQHLANPGAFVFREHVFKRAPVEDIVDKLMGVDVVGFSAYVWNINISLAAAQRLKARAPDTLIVFGGPQVPDCPDTFLREHPFIDLVCHGEGEVAFAAILDHTLDRDWSQVPSVSYVRPSGEWVMHERAPRVQDLESIPSPYLTGVFDSIIANHPDDKWIMLWETNRGCPFHCTYCDWGSAVGGKVYKFEMARLQAELDWFAAHKGEFIFCCDANFGMLPRDIDIVEYAGKVKSKTGYPSALSVQNTKNATDRSYQVQKRLSDHRMNAGVTLSMQTLDRTTLKNIRRDNISSESFQELQRRYTRDRIDTYTDVILGLPGETYETFKAGVSKIIDDGQHNRIMFYNLSILPNAEMGDPAYQRQFGMVTVPQQIIAMHSAVNEVDEVAEYYDTVVATASMPAADWVKAKMFWWMSEMLYFDRIAQISFVLLRGIYQVAYHELVEACLQANSATHPVLGFIQNEFKAKATAIQQGDIEYLADQDWLQVWWPAHQHVLIKLQEGGLIDALFAELEQVVAELLRTKCIDHDPLLVHEGIEFNKAMYRLPGLSTDLKLNLSHNILEFYQAVLLGQPAPLENHLVYRYNINRRWFQSPDLDDWCEHLIESHNRKSLHLYPAVRVAA